MKKMKLFSHNKTWKAAALAIETSHKEVLSYLCKNIGPYKKYGNDFSEKTLNVCYLDPGGMYNMKIPRTSFEVQGITFDIQMSKIEEVLMCMKSIDTSVPGFVAFPNWRYLVVLTQDTYDELGETLTKLEKSDGALHYELQDRLTRDTLKEDRRFKLTD